MATDEPFTLDDGRPANGVRDKPPSPAGRPSSKRCSKCGETKPLSGFHAKATNPDGLQRWCKDCRNAAERKRLAARTPEEVEARRVYYRGWKSRNRERVRAYNRRLYRENDEYRQRVNRQTAALGNRVRLARKEMLEMIKQEMGCLACGKRSPASDLQFHHVNPAEKEYTIGVMTTRPIDVLVAEVSKCAVLCLMCHASYHRRALDIPKRRMEKARRRLAKAVRVLPSLEADRRKSARRS